MKNFRRAGCEKEKVKKERKKKLGRGQMENGKKIQAGWAALHLLSPTQHLASLWSRLPNTYQVGSAYVSY